MGTRDWSRRELLRAAGSAGLGAVGLSALGGCGAPDGGDEPPRGGSGPVRGPEGGSRGSMYVPPPEAEGGWRRAEPGDVGMDPRRLAEAVAYHDTHRVSTSHGAALVIIHQGHLVGESYVTGVDGGPERWTADTCNDMKSSTKSVFGTAVGVFLEEYGHRVDLETPLVGTSREGSLIPQIWDRDLTDEAKTRIQVKHALSMTSGHETREPWLAPTERVRRPGYGGPCQMYEYCFGWWRFADVPDQHTLKFEPGSEFNYSNYGLEQLALAMRNVSGERVGPYVWDRVLGPIGMDPGLRDNEYGDMPYFDERELNFSGDPGWGIGGSTGCDAYGADGSESPYGVNSVVGSTFRCTARDFARLAYLWLHRGRWGERQLVPETWMDQATRRYRRDDGSTPSPYGYTFWVMDGIEGVPSDLVMSRGHNLNHSFVIPSLDLVVVRQGNDNRRMDGSVPFADEVIRRIVAAVG